MPDDSTNPLDFYGRRSRELQVDAEEARNKTSVSRLSLAVLALLACWLGYKSFIVRQFPLWLPAVVIPFAVLINRQLKRSKQRSLQIASLLDYCDKGTARLKRDWKPLDEGKEFADREHFYAADLDLFGRGSLFQLLCSARTQTGRETLATWMKAPASREEVLARHGAVCEIRARQDLRESLASAGSKTSTDCKPETFRAWLEESQLAYPGWARAAAIALVTVTVSLPVLYWIGLFTLHTLWTALGVMLAVEAVFAAQFLEETRSTVNSIGPPSTELPIIFALLQLIESEPFSAPRLAALKTRLTGTSASQNIRSLQRLMSLAKERDYSWFTALSWCLLWTTQFSMAIDRWRRRHGAEMLEWLTILGEYEALVSIANYSFEHSADVLPELMEQGPFLHAESLAHPLLKETVSVRNDLHLDGALRFLIISGSNMSGKSTFLRSVGLNAVLAWMGAPVRCAKLQISQLAIGAAIRVEDSLLDGRSHFLAEMQRLRRMIVTAGEKPLLFLADEIMIGTNSQDRRIAAEWVVRALVLRGALGLITTHDLALTELATNGLPGGNVHFEDSGERGELLFDYKLRPGLLMRSNALNIARMLGIDDAATQL
jgi:MutS domain V